MTSSSSSEQTVGGVGQNDPRDLLDTQDWLSTQALDYRAALSAAKNDAPLHDEDTETVLNRLSSLKRDLLSASQAHHLRGLMLRRLALTEALTRVLFPTAERPTDISEAAYKTRDEVRELCEEQRVLVSQTMNLQQELSEVREQLDAVRADNRELMLNIRETREDLRQESMKEDESRRSKKATDALQRAGERLEAEQNEMEVVRHIFMGLVLGSGLNWAQDAQLRETVLGLGQPLEDMARDTT